MQFVNQKNKITALLNDKELGYLEYELINDDALLIKSVVVLDTARGMGLGRKLVDSALNHAYLLNLKIKAECTFAKSIFSKYENEYEKFNIIS